MGHDQALAAIIKEAFATNSEIPAVLIDARSPSEFVQGHIPGALNVPLLDDEQRHLVGLCYKEKGRQAAIDLGFSLTGSLFCDKLQQARSLIPQGIANVYCARGGLRSEIITWLLNKGGIQATQLHGGYKEWRQFCIQQFEKPLKWFVLAGMTGVGKTEILSALQSQGSVILDLEALAQHKGSAFGGLGQPAQSTQEQFENRLAMAIAMMPQNEIVWMEDESRFIGKLRMPEVLYENKLLAKRIVTERSFESRIQRILGEYGLFNVVDLAEKTKALEKRLGNDQVKNALGFLDSGDMKSWVTILLKYYDKLYHHGMEQHKHTFVASVQADSYTLEALAKEIISIANSHHE
jgi:tRNA 2-selenouridine synthase